MMNKRNILAVLLCVIMLLSLCACNKESNLGGTPGHYTDDYQSIVNEIYDDISVKMRTSSSVYFPGSVIAITAVIENNSDMYYLVAPYGNGFSIDIKADGYSLVQIEDASASDIAEAMVLEPNGSVSVTKEFMTNALVNGSEYPVWECEAVAYLDVGISDGKPSKDQVINSKKFSSKKAETTITIHGSSKKPQ